MSKPTKQEFLTKYRITEKAFTSSGLKWNDLLLIYDDHQLNTSDYQKISNYIYEVLRDCKEVHSIRRRVKDPEHLIEKIIRKSIEDPSLALTLSNYKDLITDLIGVRILHLFKDDWTPIHNIIIGVWDVIEKPTANIRNGDKEDEYIAQHCVIKHHQYGYRSVHYLVKFPFTKDIYHTVEIQVRTVFEEAWSEIDHTIRYPYDINNPILAGYLDVFNSLAGSSDQMGLFIKVLKHFLDEQKQKLDEKDEMIVTLKNEISKSSLEKQEKQRINKSLNIIQQSINYSDFNNFLKSYDIAKITSQNVAKLNDKIKALYKIPILSFNNDYANNQKVKSINPQSDSIEVEPHKVEEIALSDGKEISIPTEQENVNPETETPENGVSKTE